jgi:hypothetical protein
MNTTKAFKDQRLIKALSGVSVKEFQSLLPAFEQAVYEDSRLRSKAKERHFGGGAKGKLITIEDKLFSYWCMLKHTPHLISLVLYSRYTGHVLTEIPSSSSVV